MSAARFAPDGETVIYSAAWGGDDYGLFMTRRGSPESRPLNIADARLLGVSSTGDLAFLRGSHDAVRLLAAFAYGHARSRRDDRRRASRDSGRRRCRGLGAGRRFGRGPAGSG